MKRACLLVVLLCSVACGMEMRRLVVQPNTLVEITVDEPSLWLARQPLDLDIRNYARVDDEGEISAYVGVFHTGRGGRQIILDEIRNGRRFPIVIRHVVTVGDDPSPPNPPDPPDPPEPDDPPEPPDNLSSYAKSVFRGCIKVDEPAMARKLGEAYGAVASAIAAGGVRSLQQANDAINAELKIVGPMDRKWKPLNDAIAKYVQANAQTLDKAEMVFSETSKGFLAAWDIEAFELFK